MKINWEKSDIFSLGITLVSIIIKEEIHFLNFMEEKKN